MVPPKASRLGIRESLLTLSTKTAPPSGQMRLSQVIFQFLDLVIDFLQGIFFADLLCACVNDQILLQCVLGTHLDLVPGGFAFF